MILTAILLVAVGVVLLYLVVLLKRHPVVLPDGESASVGATAPLPAFSSDIRFADYPQRVPVENPYDCNARSLRKCRLDDATTLAGCRELAVRCHHFATDTVHVEHNEPVVIPRNESPTEGYALAISVLSEACNPYHGDLTLVTVDPASKEYMLLCTCKNNGYIGNMTLQGACDTPFICNGQVTTLDAPLDQIECKCAPYERTARYEDGLPVCSALLVHEANALHADWTDLITWDNARLLPIDCFSPTVRENTRTRVLLNPCNNALTDPRSAIPSGYYDASIGQCVTSGNGFPVALGLLATTADAGLALAPNEAKPTFPSAVLPTSDYWRIRVSGAIAGRARVFAIVVRGIQFGPPNRGDLERGFITLVPDQAITVGGRNGRAAVSIVPRMGSFWAPRCYESTFSYYCTVRENFGRSSPSGLTLAYSHPPPTLFLWGTERWTITERVANSSIQEGTFGIIVSAKALANDEPLWGYGAQWCAYYDPEASGVLSFTHGGDFALHRSVLS